MSSLRKACGAGIGGGDLLELLQIALTRIRILVKPLDERIVKDRIRSISDATFSVVFFLESDRIRFASFVSSACTGAGAGTHLLRRRPRLSNGFAGALGKAGPTPSRRRRMRVQASWSRGFSSTRRKDIRSLMCSFEEFQAAIFAIWNVAAGQLYLKMIRPIRGTHQDRLAPETQAALIVLKNLLHHEVGLILLPLTGESRQGRPFHRAQFLCMALGGEPMMRLVTSRIGWVER